MVFIVNHFPKFVTVFTVSSVAFDFWDGRIARKLKAASEFGVELDSLADVSVLALFLHWLFMKQFPIF
ncbi:CDP-alcohol phosphatidyltransferase family protein [Ferviditalea candida]|uniref:CDP-alcohol phosphatidyltransferase family protein n=1 Tax=Ferviditalea candida TaxID=3108399 RepID=UPI00352CB15B